MVQCAHYFSPPDNPDDDDPQTSVTYGEFHGEGEDLAYKVEIWDASGEIVEQLVALTTSPTIGYAAYYAATREFPGRLITLRHKSRILSRWSGQAH
jgi:hypothetical protein